MALHVPYEPFCAVVEMFGLVPLAKAPQGLVVFAEDTAEDINQPIFQGNLSARGNRNSFFLCSMQNSVDIFCKQNKGNPHLKLFGDEIKCFGLRTVSSDEVTTVPDFAHPLLKQKIFHGRAGTLKKDVLLADLHRNSWECVSQKGSHRNYVPTHVTDFKSHFVFAQHGNSNHESVIGMRKAFKRLLYQNLENKEALTAIIDLCTSLDQYISGRSRHP